MTEQLKSYDVTAWKDFTSYAVITIQAASPAAAMLASIYKLTARLVRQSGQDAAAFEHNAQELTRMGADLELAKVGNYDPGITIGTLDMGGAI